MPTTTTSAPASSTSGAIRRWSRRGRPTAATFVGGGHRAAAVRQRHADAAAAHVEGEGPTSPGQPSKAAQARAGRRPDLVERLVEPRRVLAAGLGQLGALAPAPPLTVLAASAMSSPAWRPPSLVAAATRATPPSGFSPPMTAARMPGCWRTATARSRTSSGARPSTRATTTPSTAAPASSVARLPAAWRAAP